MTTLVSWRSVVIMAGLAVMWHATTAPETLLTIAQQDAFRSPRAPRTLDVSADGRTVAFESLARLVPADKDDLRDIYVLDRTTGRVTLESDCARRRRRIHARADQRRRPLRGLRVAVVDVDVARTAIVLHDRTTGATRVLTPYRTTNPNGWSRDPDISDDGQVVAFSSASTTLTAGTDANGVLEDVYLVRLPAGTITRASVDSKGVQAESGNSILPALSSDGRWLAFASTAPLDEDARPASSRERAVRHVYLRDTIGGRTIRVTRDGKPRASKR